MTCEEFSDQFDVLLNAHSQSGVFGEGAGKAYVALDEYEKSVLLTKAQEDLVISLYNGKNSSGDTFEGSEELRRYLSNLVEEATLEAENSSNSSDSTDSNGVNGVIGVDGNSKFFVLPKDAWYITYEAVNLSDAKCSAYSPMDVYPVTQDDYHKTKRNPFRGANDRRALRLDLADRVVEIVSKYTVSSYYLRYLKKPRPIILVDLSDGLSIEGESEKSECELHEGLHRKILDLAVRYALSRIGVRSKE